MEVWGEDQEPFEDGVWGLGFGDWGLGLEVYGLWFRVSGPEQDEPHRGDDEAHVPPLHAGLG